MTDEASAERKVLGEHANGSESDDDTSASIAMRCVKAGLGGVGLFLGEDRLPHMYLTDEWKSPTLARTPPPGLCRLGPGRRESSRSTSTP
jgi:hypothetical protein